MTNGDDTAIDVNLFKRDLEVLNRENGLTSKSLVDFLKINFVFCESDEIEDFGNGECRPNTHDAWWYTDDGGVNEFGQAKSLCNRATSE
jgi:hypothetical protein